MNSGKTDQGSFGEFYIVVVVVLGDPLRSEILIKLKLRGGFSWTQGWSDYVMMASGICDFTQHIFYILI